MPPTHGIGHLTQGTCTRVGPDAAWQPGVHRSPRARMRGQSRRWQSVAPRGVCTHACVCGQHACARTRRCSLSGHVAVELRGCLGAGSHTHTHVHTCAHTIMPPPPRVLVFLPARVFILVHRPCALAGAGGLSPSPTQPSGRRIQPNCPPPAPNPGCFPPGLPCKRAFSGPRWGGPALHPPPCRAALANLGLQQVPAPVAPAGGARLPPANPRVVEGAATAPGKRRLWQLMQRRASEFFSGKHGF